MSNDYYERGDPMLLRINEFWDWFLYYRKGRIKYKVWDFGDTYAAEASNGVINVMNCYGGTPEAAKEMALYRLKEAIAEVPKEKELVAQGEGFAHYRDK